jgi:outer membrane protein insertion porin family
MFCFHARILTWPVEGLMTEPYKFDKKRRTENENKKGLKGRLSGRALIVCLILSSVLSSQPILAIATGGGENSASSASDSQADQSVANSSESSKVVKVEVEDDVKASAASGDASSPSNGSSAQKGTTLDSATVSGSEPKIGSNVPANLTIDDVRIEGNRLVPAEDIMSVVKTKRGDKFDRDIVMQDLKAINNMGYFDDRNLQVVPELTTGGVLLKIRVQENAPVTQFSFEGNTVLSTDEIQKTFVDQLGKPQNLGSLSTAIDKVEQAYHEKGFVLARVADVKDDPDGSVGLKINEGIIDKIEIAGNKRTKDFIIRNGIKMKPGTVYNESQLTADLRKLYANGYFQDVKRSLSPSPTNPDHFVLKVEVEEKRTASVGVGGGIDTVAGPFGSFNISDSNFGGRGQVLSLNTQVGSGMIGNLNNALTNGGQNTVSNLTTYMAELSFIEPNLGGTNTAMSASLFGRDYNSWTIPQAMQKSIGTTVNFSKTLLPHLTANIGVTADNTWFQDVSSLYTTQDIMLNMVTNSLNAHLANSVPQAFNLAQQTRDNMLKGGAYLSVNPNIALDTRDAKIDPSHGTLIRLSATPSLGLTNSSFVKLGASASQYIKVNNSITLAGNVQGGTTFGGVPQFGMFNLGGMNGVRGYRSFTDLGMGTGMLMGTAEIRTKLPFLSHSESKALRAVGNHLKGTIFFDAGQVVGNNQTNTIMGRSNLGASVGVGLRLNIPMVGLVRVDYGLPLLSSVMGGRFYPRINIGFGERF